MKNNFKQREIKFKFYCIPAKDFVEQYKYSGYVEELFGEDPTLHPCQFTGIRDCKGIEIYENDIIEIECVNWHRRPTYRGVVEFINGCFACKIINPTGTLSLFWFHHFGDNGEEGSYNTRVTVVGNRFQENENK